MGENNGFINGTKINPTGFLEALDTCSVEDQNIMFQMGRKCVQQKQKDMCERSYAMHLCMRKTDPVHYYI